MGPQPILPVVPSWAVPLAAALIALVVPAAASAQPAAELAAPSSEYSTQPMRGDPVRLDSAPGWSIGADAYAGFAVFGGSSRLDAHAIAGGLARVRVGYVYLGALIEQSDESEEEWRAVGGLAGAFLPYRSWVDFELAAGVVQRTHQNDDPRYGPGGFDVANWAVLLRAGFSDRSSASLFGVRVGAHLVAMFDLGTEDRTWRYNLGEVSGMPRYITGNTSVGGHSVSLVASAGFDLAPAQGRVRSSP